MKTILRSILTALLWAFSSASVQAQGFPTKPVKFIVNYAPGGGTDIMARLLAEAMREDLGQPVIVENRAGAGGALGAAEVARRRPMGIPCW